MIIPLTPAKKKPRYRAVVVGHRSFDWHDYIKRGWSQHRVLVYAGGNAVATLIKRIA